MVPNITEEIVKRLKLLQPGVCIAFGNAFKLPLFVKMDMPNPSPTSSSIDISASWFVNKPSHKI
jgi:DNA helicase HerA-like ATPase